ncbi:MAG: hypothetical protein K6B68_02815 [Eubacterium sp.]|nr:hypothetical protein [Eubacterium sp.]
MIEKEDMILILKALDALDRLNQALDAITGSGLDYDPYGDFYELYEIIRRHSKYSGTSNYDEDNLREIVYDHDKTTEEKYELLTA